MHSAIPLLETSQKECCLRKTFGRKNDCKVGLEIFELFDKFTSFLT